MRLSQHKLCARKTELALDVNFRSTFNGLHGHERWPTEMTSNTYTNTYFQSVWWSWLVFGFGFYTCPNWSLANFARATEESTYYYYYVFICWRNDPRVILTAYAQVACLCFFRLPLVVAVPPPVLRGGVGTGAASLLHPVTTRDAAVGPLWPLGVLPVDCWKTRRLTS